MASPSLAAAPSGRAGVLPSSRVRKYALWGAGLALWVSLVSLGVRQRFLYETTAGDVGQVPSSFPSDSSILRHAGQRTLLMFVHPECPCTKASLTELATLFRAPVAKLDRVLVVAPLLDAKHTFEDTLGMARSIPGLTRFDDRDEAEAARFGARTSGFVMLYDADGSLLFSGGITGSRGHVGENVALRSLRGLLASESSANAQHPVYGCPLDDRESP